MRFRAPATSANLGPGFDCAACAFELWNELELSDGSGVTIEGEGTEGDEGTKFHEFHLVNAFGLLQRMRARSRSTARLPMAAR